MKKFTPLIFLLVVCVFEVQSQNVGISDVLFTPQSSLHVYRNSDSNILQLSKSSTANTGLIFSVSGNNWTMRNWHDGELQFRTGNSNMTFYTNSSERMLIQPDGNVGIGTTSPSAQLHTTGTVRFANYPSGANGAILRTDNNGNLGITNFTGDANDVLLGTGSFGPLPATVSAWEINGNSNTVAGTNFIGTTNGQALDFRTNNTLRFRVANANQVHAMVDGNAVLPFYSFANNTGIGMYRSGQNQLGFSTSGAERLRLVAGGQIQAVSDGNADTPVWSFGNNSKMGLFRAGGNILGVSTNGLERMRVDASGLVGINTTGPTQRLHVEGNVRFSGALMPNNQAGTSGQVLVSQGAGAAPVWSYAATTIRSVSGITDASIGGTTWTNMPDMSITFTPVKSVVFVSFTSSGYSDMAGQELAYARIVKDGVPLLGTSAIVSEDDGWGSIITSWNLAINYPVTVTPGVSTTIKIQWRTYHGVSTLYNYIVSDLDKTCHRTLFIYE